MKNSSVPGVISDDHWRASSLSLPFMRTAGKCWGFSGSSYCFSQRVYHSWLTSTTFFFWSSSRCFRPITRP
eukprot:3718001-Alexandrium_andersonii.AAC.1